MKEERLIGNSGIEEVRQQGLRAVEEIRQSAGVLNDFLHVEENSEYLDLTVDEEGNLMEGNTSDGTKEFGGNVKIHGNLDLEGSMNTSSYEESSKDNDEYAEVKLSEKDGLIEAVEKNGTKVIGTLKVQQSVELPSSEFNGTDDEENLSILMDNEKTVLSRRSKDGMLHETVGVDIGGASEQSAIDDEEKRMEIKTDFEGREISFRDDKGMLHENVGIASPEVRTDNLNLSEKGMTDFQNALIASGFKPGGRCDWTYYLSNDGERPLCLPIPNRAVVNIIVDFDLRNLSKKGRGGSVENVNYDIPCEVEFWDFLGNYFKKPALISGQGNATMDYAKKNIAIDFFDSSVENSKGAIGKGDAFSMKFGDWVPQDSFHMKANATESFRAMNHFAYKVYNDIVRSRGIKDDYVWKRALIDFDSIGRTNVDKAVSNVAWNTGARCFPDGFPVIMYHNGDFWGIYFWSIKKHRDNYHMDSKSAKHLHFDGIIDDTTLFPTSGVLDWPLLLGKKANFEGRLDGVEVRNPKNLYCVNVSYSYIVVTDANEIAVVKGRHAYSGTQVDPTAMSDEEIRATFGKNPPVYLMNLTDNDTLYRIIETPAEGCSKYDADVNAHELIDETMACYDANNKDHKRTKDVKHNMEAIADTINVIKIADDAYEASEKTDADIAAFKAIFEEYFDIDNLVDYNIFGDLTDNWDGFRGKNWQWLTYDAKKFYIGVYDCDATFGLSSNINMLEPMTNHVCLRDAEAYEHARLMSRYFLKFYTPELEARYKILRDTGVIDLDRIVGILSLMVDIIGKEYYDMEWSKWNTNLPIDNIYRVMNWIKKKIEILDSLYNYSI